MDILALIPSFGGLIYTLIAFVVSLSIIVAVHEYGHYIIGRWSGIHAEVFSLGFGPKLFSWVDQRGTRWQLSALPFGGYVKFFGDADAASGKDGEAMASLTEEERRHTMHGAPLWARASTVAAGPVFNFILSIIVFAAFFLVGGLSLEQPVVGKLQPLPEMGQPLQSGDKILSVDGEETPDLARFYEVADKLAPSSTARYVVMRDDAEVTLDGPFPFPPLINTLQPGSAAMDAGLQVGDVITAIDDQPIFGFAQLRDTVGASDGKQLTLGVWRDGETLEVTLTPRRMDIPLASGGFETRWLIGMTGGLFFENQTRVPGIGEAFKLGAMQVYYIAKTSLSGLYHMVTGSISSCNLSGPLGIAEASGDMASQGAASFLQFIAMLSTAVGLLNLFPIPVLDGGHLVFHAWEAVTGRPPNDKALRVLMSFGLAFLLTMMVFALGNDVFCP